MYIIAMRTSYDEPLAYFCADSFWHQRHNATRFPSREAAERHILVIAQEDRTDPSLYHAIPA